MSPDTVFYTGIIICAVTAISAVITALALRARKTRLDKQLYSEYGDISTSKQ